MATQKLRCTIYGAKLVLKNFQGKATDYNAEGDRNFGVLLDPETADRMSDDGWNVKCFKPRQDDPDQNEQPWIKVKIGKYDPLAVLINTRGKIRLTRDMLDQLDWTRIKNCDLTIVGIPYDGRGRIPSGISAYLNSIYVTVQEDELEEKYSGIPDLDMDRSEYFDRE